MKKMKSFVKYPYSRVRQYDISYVSFIKGLAEIYPSLFERDFDINIALLVKNTRLAGSSYLARA